MTSEAVGKPAGRQEGDRNFMKGASEPKGSQRQAAKERRSQGTKEPRNQGAKEPKSQAAKEPRSQGIKEAQKPSPNRPENYVKSGSIIFMSVAWVWK